MLNYKKTSFGFGLWLVSFALVVLIVVIFVTAWSVRHISRGGSRFSDAQARVIIAVAEFPAIVYTALQEVRSGIEGDPLPLLMDRKSTEHPYWLRKFPEPSDSGYLLFSGVDASKKRADVKLIKISDGTLVARWEPDWSAIMAKTSPNKFMPSGNSYTLLPIHPVLLPDGDIIFNHTSGSLVRMSPCTSKPIWILDQTVHHSNELDETGSAIWVPSISQDGYADNKLYHGRVRDDALARVSLEGKLLEKRSFVRILRENGLHALLMGTSGFAINEDPIHLNEIKVALQDGRYWNRGDLLISARNLSSLFLYRPSTNKILWYQTGPWMNQHSVDFVGDHRISVFDNNVIGGPAASRETAFLTPNDINQVMVYDFDTNEVTQPFAELLALAKPVTITAGRARILPDGGLFLEENNYGRILRFTKSELLWSLVNDYDEKRIGVLAWSRYLTEIEARIPLQSLVKRACQPSN